jgi:hypothetical protein
MMLYIGFLCWTKDLTHAKLLIVYRILMYRILHVDTLSIHTYSKKIIINLLLSYINNTMFIGSSSFFVHGMPSGLPMAL